MGSNKTNKQYSVLTVDGKLSRQSWIIRCLAIALVIATVLAIIFIALFAAAGKHKQKQVIPECKSMSCVQVSAGKRFICFQRLNVGLVYYYLAVYPKEDKREQ